MLELQENGSHCNLSEYIDNYHICRVTGEQCKCMPRGVPNQYECDTHYRQERNNI